MQFLLYGEDSYRSKKQLDKFIIEFQSRRDPQGYNIVIQDGCLMSLDDFAAQSSIAPFLGEKRLLVIKRFSENKNIAVLDGVYELLKNNSLTEHLIVVFWEDQILDKKGHPLFDFLAKEKYSQEFSLLSENQQVDWVIAQVENCGTRIDRSAALLLAEMIGSDLGSLELEIQKLTAWAKSENKKIISRDDIRFLIPIANDDEVFHFIDALFQGKTDTALRLLYDQKQSGISEQVIFGALLWQMRTLLEIKDFTERNPHVRSDEMAKKLAIHPFVIKKTSGLLPRISMSFLNELHQCLLDVDSGIKTGRLPAPLAFDQLVVTFAERIK